MPAFVQLSSESEAKFEHRLCGDWHTWARAVL